MNQYKYERLLLDKNYAESTSAAYAKAVYKIERALNTKLYGADPDYVAKILVSLDKGGEHEKLGDVGNRTVFNGVKQYLIAISEEGYTPGETAQEAPEEDVVEDITDDVDYPEFRSLYRNLLRAIAERTGYNFNIVDAEDYFNPNRGGVRDEIFQWYMLKSIRVGKNLWSHVEEDERDPLFIDIAQLYIKIILNKLN